jgi:tRNA threonylcarbamoyladenosine biosynthesis protein TsaE
MKNSQFFLSKSKNSTYKFGYEFASKLKTPSIVSFNGELGVGKSILIRGILNGLGVKEIIPSPTFTIVNEYRLSYPIYHFDLYRINKPFELYEIGFEEYIYSNGISLIEWGDKAEELLPKNCIRIDIKIEEKNKRRISINE